MCCDGGGVARVKGVSGTVKLIMRNCAKNVSNSSVPNDASLGVAEVSGAGPPPTSAGAIPSERFVYTS